MFGAPIGIVVVVQRTSLTVTVTCSHFRLVLVLFHDAVVYGVALRISFVSYYQCAAFCWL